MVNKIVIIGAGVVGTASALALQKDGHDVTLIDREAPCSGASFGNAGAIINGSCTPTAMPGIFFDAIKMLSQANSPLSIPLSYFHKIMPWLMRFIWQSRSSAAYQNATHLHAISQYAVASWRELTEHSELASLFRETGWLKVYQSEKSFASSTRHLIELFDKMATKYEILNASQIRDLELNLAPIFNYGIYQKDSLSIVELQCQQDYA
ncbi:MAG: FAD-dependent oxidoreductase [Colwellia sp.]|nr:FAD-dependent oxidoreductase [Colwellia sp.]